MVTLHRGVASAMRTLLVHCFPGRVAIAVRPSVCCRLCQMGLQRGLVKLAGAFIMMFRSIHRHISMAEQTFQGGGVMGIHAA